MISANGISFGYTSNKKVVDHWSAEFRPGSVTAITGPSGKGKSTLLYILGLMLRPDSGSVVFNGLDVTNEPDHVRASIRAHSFGFVFQDAALDASRTVLDNVSETALYRGDDREEALQDALALLDRFGVDVPASSRPGQVSGGQAQRIALCRALLGRPRVLLADEPTGNLDADSAAVVLGAFRKQADEGGTVVVVTHDRAVVARCDLEIRL